MTPEGVTPEGMTPEGVTLEGMTPEGRGPESMRLDAAAANPSRGVDQTANRDATSPSPGTAFAVRSAVGAPGSDEPAQARGQGDPTAPDPVEDDDVSEPASISINVSGDILPHMPVQWSARGPSGLDFAPLLAEIEPVVSSADVALCHLETPLVERGGRGSGYPTFATPGELADGLGHSGFDGCSVASNHVLDRGPSGVVDTLDELTRVGLGSAGAAASPSDDPTAWYGGGGLPTVAHLSYAYGFNGFDPPADRPWLVNRIDEAAIIAAARTARSQGAEVIVVSLHWGTQYVVEPDASQRRLAAALALSGEIDLIVGHHAHVVQPIERVGETWVIFGLGNLLSNQSASCCTARSQDGLLATVHFEVEEGRPSRVTDIELVPTFVDRSRHVVLPASPGPDGTWLDRQVAASRERTEATLGPIDDLWFERRTRS